ncbi:MAG: hypothetical protein Q8O24_01375 [Gallionellaceae bacterium]|nr:hypothetical protein [Gallionellaceae bacterium]
MKKIVLTLASVMAATVFAPEASAIPSFARQTGMGCSACHQQHYPVLNGFGQAFKASGYTMMGAQGKIEGEHLSIPETLNAAVLLKARYQKSTTTGATPDTISGTNTESGQWQIPDELSLFFGGRVADQDSFKMGMMMENNLVGGPAGGIIAGMKLPMVYEAGDLKFMAIPYLTDALGVAYGFEQSSTGMTRGIRWAEHRSDISAAQYTGMGSGAASGLAFVALHEMGYINVSKWSPAFAYVPGAEGSGIQMSSTWVRLAATPTVADWAMHIGFGSMSGQSYNSWALPTSGAVSYGDEAAMSGTTSKTEATVLDFQAHGQVGGNDLGIYVTYASVPSGTKYNTGAQTESASTIGADYSLIPHTLHLGAAMRNGTTGAGRSDNSISAMAIYDLTQNVALHLNHSIRSGQQADAGSTEKSLTTFMLEAAW